jgi:diguanylate cyclase (GGDEF)-like protein
MKVRLAAWLSRMERLIVNRRDSTSSLVLIEWSLPFLLLLLGMQLYAASDAKLSPLYQESWLWPTLWAQVSLIAWLVCMGAVAWCMRDNKRPLSWLVQLTVLPTGWGMLLLTVGHGQKDTTMCMLLLSEFVLMRSLFPLRQLKCLLVGSLLILLGSEWLTMRNWMPYAPMLAEPLYRGYGMSWWWSLWSRTLYLCAALPLSGWFFFLASTLHRNRLALENVARTDLLTGLTNRREFMDRLERESHRHARSLRPLSIVMCDVDHFKRINDSHGHPAGDEVLARIGAILRTSTRAQIDAAARYGGEEFVLLLPETDLHGARMVAEKITAALRQETFRADGQTFKVTLSAGVAEVVHGDTNWALKVADDNLYQAKQAGRDHIIASVAHGLMSEPATQR